MPNERLRLAIASSGLSLEELGERIGVNPKSIERWVTQGRAPYKRNQYLLASALGADVAYLWGEVRDHDDETSAGKAELYALYPHRSTIPLETWRQLFEHTNEYFDVLAYGGFWLSEDPAWKNLVARKAQNGIRVRFLLGDPNCDEVAKRGADEGVGDAMAAKIRNTLINYRTVMKLENVEVRLHDTILYNSIYRADEEMLVNTHIYGVIAYMAPVLHLKRVDGSLFSAYVDSFEAIWDKARPIDSPEEA